MINRYIKSAFNSPKIIDSHKEIFANNILGRTSFSWRKLEKAKLKHNPNKISSNIVRDMVLSNTINPKNKSKKIRTLVINDKSPKLIPLIIK